MVRQGEAGQEERSCNGKGKECGWGVVGVWLGGKLKRVVAKGEIKKGRKGRKGRNGMAKRDKVELLAKRNA